MATILYARVSTVEQTIGHQRAQAEGAGFVIDEIVADNGVSGVHTRLAERPQGKRLCDKLRAGDVLVVRWVDRLGRNYEDVVDTIREFMRRGIVIRTVINNFTFDGATKDPMQQAVRDALIAFMAALSQAQAEATKAAQRVGIEHAQAERRARLPRPQAELQPGAVRSGPRDAGPADRDRSRDRQGDGANKADDLSDQGGSDECGSGVDGVGDMIRAAIVKPICFAWG